MGDAIGAYGAQVRPRRADVLPTRALGTYLKPPERLIEPEDEAEDGLWGAYVRAKLGHLGQMYTPLKPQALF